MLRISANGARAPGAMLPQMPIRSGIQFSIGLMGHGWCGEGGVAIALHHGYAVCTYLSGSVVVWHRHKVAN